MGLIVDFSETPHDIEFEVRRESVKFWDTDKECLEITKALLWRIRNLLNDPDWSDRLTEKPNDRNDEQGEDRKD